MTLQHFLHYTEAKQTKSFIFSLNIPVTLTNNRLHKDLLFLTCVIPLNPFEIYCNTNEKWTLILLSKVAQFDAPK